MASEYDMLKAVIENFISARVQFADILMSLPSLIGQAQRAGAAQPLCSAMLEQLFAWKRETERRGIGRISNLLADRSRRLLVEVFTMRLHLAVEGAPVIPEEEGDELFEAAAVFVAPDSQEFWEDAFGSHVETVSREAFLAALERAHFLRELDARSQQRALLNVVTFCDPAGEGVSAWRLNELTSSSGIERTMRFLSQPKEGEEEPGEAAADPWLVRYEDLDFTCGGAGKKTLGEGASGKVRLAKYHGENVAVKITRGGIRNKDLFAKECAVLRALRHDNLVLFVGECSDPKLCLVFEAMLGGSLYSFLHEDKANRPLALIDELKLEVLQQIAEGMEYLHANRVVHRDLKSPNVLMAFDPLKAKIADFGLSKVMEQTVAGATMTARVATPVYQAPEIFGSKLTSFAQFSLLDTYSFGILCWEVFSEEVPFTTNPDAPTEAMQLMFAVKEGLRPEPMTPVAAVNDLITRCWSGDPAARPRFDAISSSLVMIRARIGYNAVAQAPPLDVDIAMSQHDMQQIVMQLRRCEEEEAAHFGIELASPREMRIEMRTVGDLKAQGDTALKQGDVDGAIACLRMACSLNEGDAAAHAALAVALDRKHETPLDAAHHYKRAFELDPRRKDCMHAAVQLLKGMGREREARELQTPSKRTKNPLAKVGLIAATTRIFLLFKAFRFEQALALCQQWIDKGPGAHDFHTLFVAGKCLHALGRPMDAIDMYKRAIVSDPSCTGVHTLIASIYTSVGDEAKAAEWRHRSAVASADESLAVAVAPCKCCQLAAEKIERFPCRDCAGIMCARCLNRGRCHQCRGVVCGTGTPTLSRIKQPVVDALVCGQCQKRNPAASSKCSGCSAVIADPSGAPALKAHLVKTTTVPVERERFEEAPTEQHASPQLQLGPSSLPTPPNEKHVVCAKCNKEQVVVVGARGKCTGCSAVLVAQDRTFTKRAQQASPQLQRRQQSPQLPRPQSSLPTPPNEKHVVCAKCNKEQVVVVGTRGKCAGCSAVLVAQDRTFTKRAQQASPQLQRRQQSPQLPRPQSSLPTPPNEKHVVCAKCNKEQVVVVGTRGKCAGCSAVLVAQDRTFTKHARQPGPQMPRRPMPHLKPQHHSSPNPGHSRSMSVAAAPPSVPHVKPLVKHSRSASAGANPSIKCTHCNSVQPFNRKPGKGLQCKTCLKLLVRPDGTLRSIARIMQDGDSVLSTMGLAPAAPTVPGVQPPPYSPPAAQPPHAATQAKSKWDVEYQEIALGEVLGSGNFGKVVKGVYRQRDVAVKLITGGSPDAFWKEAAMMTQMRPHRHVVQLIGVSRQPMALVVEFVEGGTLEEKLRDVNVVVSWHDIFRWLRGSLNGLIHLHRSSLLHRDLAARNVLIDRQSGDVKLTDFGLAKQVVTNVLLEARESRFFPGPCRSMAPESLATNAFSVKSDVFSFAVMIWETLSRQPPWSGFELMFVANIVATKRARLPVLVRWPKPFRDVMFNCWRSDPVNRPEPVVLASWLSHMAGQFQLGAADYAALPGSNEQEMLANYQQIMASLQ